MKVIYIQGGRGHWTVNCTGIQSFITTFLVRWFQNFQKESYKSFATNSKVHGLSIWVEEFSFEGWGGRVVLSRG